MCPEIVPLSPVPRLAPAQATLLLDLKSMRRTELVGHQQELEDLVAALSGQHPAQQQRSGSGASAGGGVAAIAGGPGEGKSKLPAVAVLHERLWFRDIRVVDLGARQGSGLAA